MYFSPAAIFIPVKGRMHRIPWRSLEKLDCAYPKGKFTWKLKTVDGDTYNYSFEEGAPWNVHKVVEEMIERYGGWDRNAMMPIPSHLRECVKRTDVAVSEEAGRLIAPVVCPCGSSELELFYPGQTREVKGRPVIIVIQIDGHYFLRLEARCGKCGKNHLLLDKDFHGWNGFVCHDEKQADMPRPPLEVWHCPVCKNSRHQMEVTICTEGKTFFMEETEGEFEAESWPDGFGWFGLSTHCTNCGLDIERLVDYETM